MKDIIIYTPPFKKTCGGILVLFYLGFLLDKYFKNINTYMYCNKVIKNDIYNNYILEGSKIDPDFIAIYPEIVKNNPLNSKHCVRWILCELGKHCPVDIYKSWNNNDLVFHFSSFNGNNNNNKNLFSIIYRNPIFKNLKLKRDRTCFTIRKGKKFYKNINFIHPKDSILITNQSHDELLKIFNVCKYFYCYDPYTGLSNISLLCGCVPILQKIPNVSELEYLKSRSYSQYEENITKLPGYAYGIENLDYAQKTINEGQQLIIKQDNRNLENLNKFVKDIYDKNCKENVEKYYIK